MKLVITSLPSDILLLFPYLSYSVTKVGCYIIVIYYCLFTCIDEKFTVIKYSLKYFLYLHNFPSCSCGKSLTLSLLRYFKKITQKKISVRTLKTNKKTLKTFLTNTVSIMCETQK